MPTTEQLRTRLIDKLKELFQLDQPDLDFGFYRIMHAKSKQVTEFLENDLLKIVSTAFGEAASSKTQQALAAALQKVEQTLGVNAINEHGAIKDAFAETPAGKEYKFAFEKAHSAQDTAQAEGEVYDHLYRFFERYYEDGDFISRRYSTRETDAKAAPFAIPYSGEEVKLHWANADQYYIKTAEYFGKFSIDLRHTKEVRELNNAQQTELGLILDDKPLRVHFETAAASEGEHGNAMTSDATRRYFIIHPNTPVLLDANRELVVQFEYRPDPEKKGQENTWREKRNAEAVTSILSALDKLAGAHAFKRLLRLPAPTDKQKDRPLLAKYVHQYTAANTCDYFIHKNLGEFLRRELDFYIKNEVMRLDDIDDDAPASVETYLDKLKVMRRISRQLIDFLAQLEDFQKRLWLKKKFVTQTDYCITLDRVPEEFYPEVASNEAQRNEWIKLFAIDHIQPSGRVDLLTEPTPGYSQPLTVDFLRSQPHLVLDTHLFSQQFKARLLARLENIDDQCGGLLVHSENFQALRLLLRRFSCEAQCVYIDPPYNTNASAILYRNSYRHSSWGTLMHDRLACLRKMMSNGAAIFTSIDKTERTILQHALDNVYGDSNRIEELVWAMNTNNSQAPNYSTTHEYVLVYSKDRVTVERDQEMFREPKPGYEEVMQLVASLNPSYPEIAEIETALKALYEAHKIDFRQEIEDQGLEWEDEKNNDPWKGLYNYSHAEYRDVGGRVVKEADARAGNARIWIWQEDNMSMPATKQAETTRDPNHSNYRFYEPPHPVTGKPCRCPKRGWNCPYEHDENTPDRRSFVGLDRDSRIAWGDDENKVPRIKRMLHEVETNVAKSIFSDYSDGEKETSALFGQSGMFLAPKHSGFVSRFIIHAAKNGGLVVDCFGGSGSTGHAVIRTNREDSKKRKYVLVEMGNHFETIIRPRMAKVVYSASWKAGKPQNRSSGVSHCFKYIRLESYEDVLNNLQITDDPVRGEALRGNPALRKDYMLRYMLDVETRGSQSLLNIQAFTDPTAYTLKIKKPGSDEYVERPVDMLETFNYLLGLRVEHIAAPQRFNAKFKRETDPELPGDTRTRLVIDGRFETAEDGKWWFRKVEGWVPCDPENPNNGHKNKVLIVWRNLPSTIERGAEGMEEDNLMLDEWFKKNRISTRDFEFDTIYVNGSNNLPNLQQEGDRWKVRLIEEDFMKFMWDVEDV